MMNAKIPLVALRYEGQQLALALDLHTMEMEVATDLEFPSRATVLLASCQRTVAKSGIKAGSVLNYGWAAHGSLFMRIANPRRLGPPHIANATFTTMTVLGAPDSSFAPRRLEWDNITGEFAHVWSHVIIILEP